VTTEGSNKRPGRLIGSALLAWVAIVAQAGAAHVGSDPDRAGILDASFGHTGRASSIAPSKRGEWLRFGTGTNRSGRLAAIDPGGRIAIAHGNTIIELNRNGKPNPDFARHGRLALHVADDRQLKLGGIAFDSKGRLLVSGTISPFPLSNMPGPKGYQGPPATSATIRRFLSDGRLDRTFGGNGEVETNLGLQPPVSKPIRPSPTGASTTEETFHYAAPALSVTGLAIDALDRPILTGAVVDLVASCYAGLTNLSSAYVARLSPNGEPDQSFGISGTFLDPLAIQAEEPSIDRSGRIVYTGPISNQCGHGENEETEVVALTGSGQPDQAFGSGGRFQIDYFWPESLTVDLRGKILLLAHVAQVNVYSTHNRVLRLTPTGGVDPGFGLDGITAFNLPLNEAVSTVAVDRRGRPLLAGYRRRKDKTQFMLRRMTTGGEIDRTFGRAGSVFTSFHRKAGARARDVLVDERGRIVVGGFFSDARSYFPSGTAVARYLSG
jgi:uncharacterized delta-60 repeat protein